VGTKPRDAQASGHPAVRRAFGAGQAAWLLWAVDGRVLHAGGGLRRPVSRQLAFGLLVAPRATRWAMGVMSAMFGSDMLQIAYKKAQESM
jgi:hypothetical protein